MCEACDHPQRALLEQDLRAGLPPSPVAKKYGIRHHGVVLQHERRHMRQSDETPVIVQSEAHQPQVDIELTPVEVMSEPSTCLTVQSEPFTTDVYIDLPQVERILEPSGLLGVQYESPFIRFKQAWQDVKDDPREQSRMVAWLNEQLQSDEMGL